MWTAQHWLSFASNWPMKLSLHGIPVALLCLLGGPANASAQATTRTAADFVVAWQEDFSGPNVDGAAVVCRKDATGQEDPSGLIFSLRDGVLSLGAKFEDGGVADRALMGWGQAGVAGLIFGKGGAWGFDVKEYPILEIRARRGKGLDPDQVCLWGILKRADGSRMTTRLWPTAVDDWRVTTFRLAPDSSVPKKTTPQTLVGLNIDFGAVDYPRGLEIDWIRLRTFNSQERIAERERIKRLKRYRIPHPRILDEFFPFGIWNPQDEVLFPHGLQQMSCGGFEGNYGLMVRNHISAAASAHTAGYYRYRGHWRSYGPKMDQMEAVKGFIKANRLRLDAAEAAGLRMGMHVNGLGVDLEKHGPAFVEPAIKRIVEALGDSPALLSYAIDDEPVAGTEWQIAGVKQIFEENDPNYAVIFAVNAGLYSYELWEPYVAVHVPDDYRIHFGDRRPWHVGEMSKLASKVSKRPHWMVVQAFGGVGNERKKGWGSYACPTPAELRLMTYLSLANGAKGIFYYNWAGPAGWRWAAFPVDGYGNPQAEGLLAEISRLGERLIPIGHLLLATQWADPLGSYVVQSKQTSERGLTLGVLKHRERNVTYLAVVNNNPEQDLQGSVTILSKQADPAKRVYDLDALEPVSSMSAATFPVAVLPAGEGRFYVHATPEGYEKVRSELLAEQAREVLRVMTPDVSIAERWQLDLGRVRQLRGRAEDKAASAEGREALTLSREATKALDELMAENQTLSECRRRLDAIRKLMGRINVHMPWRRQPSGNDPWKGNSAIENLVEPYWAARKEYDVLEKRFIAGASEGLLASARAHGTLVSRLTRKVLTDVGGLRED